MSAHKRLNRRTLGYQQAAADNGGKPRTVSGDGWYTQTPVGTPKYLLDWAASAEKQYREGGTEFRCSLLAGDMSVMSVTEWLADFEKNRAEGYVQSPEGSRLFPKTASKDPDRQVRRQRFLELNMFNGTEPSWPEQESEDERQALNGELKRIRKRVIGWATSWVLHHATTTDVRNQVMHALTVAAGEKGTRTLAKSYKDWMALKTALLADHGPEPNFAAFNAPAFAWEVHKNPAAKDPSGRLMAAMRDACRVLRDSLTDIGLDGLAPPPRLRTAGHEAGTPLRSALEQGKAKAGTGPNPEATFLVSRRRSDRAPLRRRTIPRDRNSSDRH